MGYYDGDQGDDISCRHSQLQLAANPYPSPFRIESTVVNLPQKVPRVQYLEKEIL